MKAFEYASARDLAEAVALLGEKKGTARILAGGTDLLTQMKERLVEPDRLVNLKEIPGLDRIEVSASGLRLGTLVRLAEIAGHPGVRKTWRALAEAAGAAASPQIRNEGTVGGNLCQRPRCWYFRNEFFHCRKKGGQECFALEGENKYHAIFGGDHCRIVHPSDTAPVLVAFDATATIRSPAGERQVPLERFFTLPEEDVTRENVLGSDDVLAGIQVPALPPGTRTTYLKIRERSSFDFALVSCAAALTFDGAACTRARIVLGGVAPIPWRCPEAEAILVGPAVDEALAARAAEAAVARAAPLSKNRYKVTMARGTIRRAVTALARGQIRPGA